MALLCRDPQAVIDMMPLKSCAAYFPTEPWEAQFCAGERQGMSCGAGL